MSSPDLLPTRKHFFLKRLYHDCTASALLFVMIFGAIAFTIIVSGVGSYALFEHRASYRLLTRDQAFQIAEAGVNYYRWHLAHNPTDYTDGTGGPGPYVHEYKDKDGDVVGSFSLAIDPPPTGTTIVTVRSTGWTSKEPTAKRTVQVRLGFPALTNYTILSNANMNFSFTTEVHGQVHSNGGIRFDGTTDSWVKSAKENYQYCEGPGQGGCSTKNGIWGAGGPKSFWQYPVPAIDFNGITTDLAVIKDAAANGGLHLTSSGKEGWHLVFKANKTIDVYKVSKRACYYGEGKFKWGWWWGNVYCYDIKTETLTAN